MGRKLGLAIKCLFPIICFTSCATPTNAQKPATEQAWFSSRQLSRSINIWRWFNRPELEDKKHYESYITDQDINSFKKAGFNSVRLAVGGAFLFDDPNDIKSPFPDRLHLLRAAINRLNSAGLSVDIDYHPRGPLKSRIESDPILREHLITMWSALAKHLSTTDHRMVFFEILNEPRFFGKSGDWNRLASQIYLAIRRVAPKHTVVISSSEYASPETLEDLHPETDGNIIYTVHFYEPHGFTGQGASFMPKGYGGMKWPLDAKQCSPYQGGEFKAIVRKLLKTPNNRKSLSEIKAEYCAGGWSYQKMFSQVSQIKAVSKKKDIPVWIGEFGVRASDAPYDDRLRWLRAAVSSFDREKLPWALWSYDDCFGLAGQAKCSLRYPPRKPDTDLICDTLYALKLRASETRWCPPSKNSRRTD